MTSKWSKSEEKSTEDLKSSYLINYDGKIFVAEATEKEIKSAFKVLKNIRTWKYEEAEQSIKEWECEEIEQKKQSPPS